MTPTTLRPPTGALTLVLLGLLALLPAVFWRGAAGAFEVPKLALLETAALALVAVWRVPVGAAWRCPVAAAVALGCGSAVLSAAASVSPRTSWQGAWESHAGVGTALALAAVFAAAWAVGRSGGHARAVLAAVVVGATAACGYGLMQVLGADPLEWEERSLWRGWARPIGTMAHPNHLGGLAALAVPLALALWAEARADRGARLALGGCIALMAAVAVASLSRAAWLAGAVGAAGWLALRGGGWSRRAWVVVAVVVAAGLAVGVIGWHGPLGERVRHGGEMASRRHIWRAAWDSFLARPALGAGTDTFAIAFARHRPPGYAALEWGVTPVRAHNELLHVLATQGAVGAAAFVLLLAALAWAGWRALGRREDRALVAGVGAALLAWVALGLFGFTVVTTGAAAAALAGLLAGLARPAVEEGVPRGGGAVVAGAAVAGWLVLLANVALDLSPGQGLAAAAVLLGQAAVLVMAWRATRGQLAGEAAVSVALRWPVVLGCGVAAVALVARPLLASCATGWGARQADAEAALRWHGRAAALAPGSAMAQLKLAACASQAAEEGRPEAEKSYRARAIAAARRAVELEGACAEHHANLGRVLRAGALAGEADGAAVVAAYEEALRRDPHHLPYLAEAARAAVRFGRAERGLELAARGLALAPEMAAFHVERANVALAARRWHDAAGHLHRAMAGQWHDDAEGPFRCLALAAVVWLEVGRHADAAEAAACVLRHQPGWAPVRYLHGRALELLGRPAEALAQYEQALCQQPGLAAAAEGRRRLAGR